MFFFLLLYFKLFCIKKKKIQFSIWFFMYFIFYFLYSIFFLFFVVFFGSRYIAWSICRQLWWCSCARLQWNQNVYTSCHHDPSFVKWKKKIKKFIFLNWKRNNTWHSVCINHALMFINTLKVLSQYRNGKLLHSHWENKFKKKKIVLCNA